MIWFNGLAWVSGLPACVAGTYAAWGLRRQVNCGSPVAVNHATGADLQECSQAISEPIEGMEDAEEGSAIVGRKSLN